MKASSISLLTAALIASITNSAVAAPDKNALVPAPPPVMQAAPGPAPAAKAAPAANGQNPAPQFVAVTPVFNHAVRYSQQHFVDEISLKPNQDKGPLRMIIQNGETSQNPTAAGASWFRIKANGDVIVTEQTLKGKKQAIIDVSGVIPPGTSQIVVDAGGYPGSAISWQLATMPLTVTSVEPKAVSPGDVVTLRGKNFPTDVNQINAIAGDSVADVIAATPNAIQVKISNVTKPGAQNLTISVPNLPPATIALNVGGAAAPVVSGVDTWAAPVGTQIRVSGKFFAPVASQNQVFFGPIAAQVVAVDNNSLTVVVPSIPGARGTVPLTVASNGKKSANSISFMVGARAVDAGYVGQVKQAVKVGDGVTTQNSSQATVSSTSSSTEHGESHAQSDGYNESTTQSSSQSGGFGIVSPDEKGF